MTGPLNIRRLGPDDGLRFRALNALFAEVFAEPGTYASAPPDPDYVRGLLADPRIVALVALDGEEIVGGLTAYELPKLEQRRSEFYIYDLAVTGNRRRRGVATALINETRRIAMEAGAWTIFVQADHGDDPAIALYSKLGVREDVMHFDIAP
jgi:aminoglycoside 3-N-acetyltransferase I